MTLPPTLQAAIDSELTGVSPQALAGAVDRLSSRYRDPKGASRQFMAADIDRNAYIACRMPATYAVVCRVLDEIKRLMPDVAPKTLLDLGSGPGTALWGACGMFDSLEQLYALEADARLLAIGKKMAVKSGLHALQQTDWRLQDLRSLSAFPETDIAIASYALGELSAEEQIEVLSRVWLSVDQILVLIEPGTPAGFKRILAWRTRLIEAGAFLVAPCPHAEACPMTGNDWCHFSQRLSRSSLHRQLKSASLGHEDEKYSYLIASKHPRSHPRQGESQGRILRHPQKHSGHLELVLCTDKGAVKKTLSRRDGELYKKARKLEWGDLCPPKEEGNNNFDF